MSNHGFVKTRKPITAEKFEELIKDLDNRVFKGHLSPSRYPDGSGWLIAYRSQGKEWTYRLFWLATSRTLETRHSHGDMISWWMCAVIQNEVALQFNGIISDEGIDDKWGGEKGKFDTFQKYKKLQWAHLNRKKFKELEQMHDQLLPPELRAGAS